jgi:hypothetical protein
MNAALTLGLGLSVLAACGQDSSTEQNQPLSAALERPFAVCQERFETCQVAPGADPVACQASMRTCLESVATFMQQSRALIENCRTEATQCSISQPSPESLACQEQLEVCVAPAFRPGASDDDAGAPVNTDEDTGVSVGAVGATGAAGAPAPGAAGSSAGPSRPGLTPRVPGTLTPADACRSELLECLTPSADLVQCATRARECVRSSLLPTI